MKLSINKRFRIALISIIILLITFTSFFIYYKVSYPGFKEQNNQLYSYDNKSFINYKVYLKPNDLYKENNLDEGKLYITEFVDYIDANINYELLGDSAADIKGEYNVIATIQGFTGERDKLLNIWEKEFPIKQYQNFNTNDGKILINEKVKLNLNEYNTFVKNIKEASKINCDTVLTLSMNVKLSGSTDKGTFEETISPSLTIPLDVPMFEIIENNIIDEPKAIEEIIQVELPVNKIIIIASSVVLLILLIALIILIFYTQIKPEKDQQEKELKKIFKKYGDRLVALYPEMAIKDSMALSSDTAIVNPIIVYAFDDLVRISDEISKPIFYRYSKDYKEIKKFFISNDNEKYIYNLVSLNSTLGEKTENITIENKSEKIKIGS